MSFLNTTRFRGSGGAGKNFQKPGSGGNAPPKAPGQVAPATPAPKPRKPWTIPKFPDKQPTNDYMKWLGKQFFKGAKRRYEGYEGMIEGFLSNPITPIKPAVPEQPAIPEQPAYYPGLPIPPNPGFGCHWWGPIANNWEHLLGDYPYGRCVRFLAGGSGLNCGTPQQVGSLKFGVDPIPAGTRVIFAGPFHAPVQTRFLIVDKWESPSNAIRFPYTEPVPAVPEVPAVPAQPAVWAPANPYVDVDPRLHDPGAVTTGPGYPMPASAARAAPNTWFRTATYGPQKTRPRADPQAGPAWGSDGGPAKPVPPHANTPPKGNDRDVKGVGPKVIPKLINAVGEGLDIIDAAYDALPPECKLKREKAPYKFGNKYTGSRTIAPSPQDKAKAIADCQSLSADFVGRFAANLIENHIEDMVIGRVSGAAIKARSRTNKKYGLRPGMESPLW